MSETDNTGQVPPISNNNSANFVDVPIENESSSLPDNESNENLATSESVSTEPFATAEPSAQATAEPSAEPSIDGESLVPSSPAPATMTKTGKALSAKQTNLQRLRSETLADMREKYAERFAGYEKPPKAKAYHAAGLTTVRQRDGEAAYTAALNDIMDKNDPKLGTNGKSTFATSRNAKKTAANTTRSIVPSMNMATTNMRMNTANRNATSRAIASIEDMGRTAKGIIDTIVQASKDISRELGRSGNTAALKQLSSTMKVKRGKKTKPLSTIYEGNNSTRNNFSRNNFSRNTLAASNLANNSTPLNLR